MWPLLMMVNQLSSWGSSATPKKEVLRLDTIEEGGEHIVNGSGGDIYFDYEI